jgi:hypothetical protein
MSAVFTWILAASSLLAPGRSHEHLSGAIADRVQAEDPLFKGDDDRRRTSALLVAIAFRESSLRADAVGDHVAGKPTSFCAFQLHLPWGRTTAEGWSGAELLEDPQKCVSAAMRMLRISMKVCPSFPLAWYASGPAGCQSARAQRISRDRMSIAQRLVRDVAVDEVTSATHGHGASRIAGGPARPFLPLPAGGDARGAIDLATLEPRRFCAGT